MFAVYTSGITDITGIAVSCVHSIVVSSILSRVTESPVTNDVENATVSIENDSDTAISYTYILLGNNKINWKGEAIIKVIRIKLIRKDHTKMKNAKNPIHLLV